MAAGQCPPRVAAATGMESVAYSPDESAAEMAAVPSGVNATATMSLASPWPVNRVTGCPRAMSQTRTVPSP